MVSWRSLGKFAQDNPVLYASRIGASIQLDQYDGPRLSGDRSSANSKYTFVIDEAISVFSNILELWLIMDESGLMKQRFSYGNEGWRTNLWSHYCWEILKRYLTRIINRVKSENEAHDETTVEVVVHIRGNTIRNPYEACVINQIPDITEERTPWMEYHWSMDFVLN